MTHLHAIVSQRAGHFKGFRDGLQAANRPSGGRGTAGPRIACCGGNNTLNTDQAQNMDDEDLCASGCDNRKRWIPQLVQDLDPLPVRQPVSA